MLRFSGLLSAKNSEIAALHLVATPAELLGRRIGWAGDFTLPAGNAVADSCSRIRENSDVLSVAPKSHDFGYQEKPATLRTKNPLRRCPPGGSDAVAGGEG